jgi:ribosomal protein S18 acetylase RimI-like enzyme
MYIITIYSQLTLKQKKKINHFLINNFNNITDYELEPQTIIILVIEDNKIVGIICLYDNKFLIEKLNNNNILLSNYLLNNEYHGCFIYNFCIHKNYRNKKIGDGLLKYCILKMKELGIDYLHTHIQNEIAYKLFLKNGFIKFDSNTDFNIMSKYL